PAPAGAPIWMVTFADMMSLLLCLFVLLLTFANFEVTKYQKFATHMRESFGGKWIMQLSNAGNVGDPTLVPPVPGTFPSDEKVDKAEPVAEPAPKPVSKGPMAVLELAPEEPEEKPGQPLQPDETTVDALQKTIEKEMSRDVQGGMVEVEKKRGGSIIRLSEKAAFPLGSDQLNESFNPVLDRVADIIRHSKGMVVQVSGHTDDIPISTERFRSNWDLSSARSASVVHYLEKKTGIDPKLIVAIGHGSSNPLVPNDSPENRAKNRRVEISIVPRQLEAPKADSPTHPAE
ncbi:MAG: OmpA family protein, partial [Rhodospirillales bacterium]|nr:OmpA family protein [Rhodospirillales bacterium]